MKYIENLNQLSILAGAIFMIAGYVMFLFPPKKINLFYGYRTPGSMKSIDRWTFSQRFAAKELIKYGGALIFSSVLGFFNFPEALFPLLIFIAAFIPILTTEIAMRKKFPSIK